jgi:hypothetical protein
MTRHAYLRAYMAGVVIPSVVLLIGFLGVIVLRATVNPDFPMERLLLFPLALVPALWGLWNMLYLALRKRRYIPLGCHGALVPLILAPSGLALLRLFDIQLPAAVPWTVLCLAMPLGMIVYYLAWKVLVGFLNDLLGIG